MIERMKTHGIAARNILRFFEVSAFGWVCLLLLCVEPVRAADSVEPDQESDAELRKIREKELWEEPLADLKNAATSGDPVASYVLGRRYEFGRGVPLDYLEAAKHYRRAAESGDPKAQSSLGAFYKRGKGVQKDLEAAFKWYTRSANQGEPYGQINLSWTYEKGITVEPDRELAEYWCQKAAEQNHVYAQFHLGQMKLNGIVMANVTFANKTVAAEWFERAANQGHVEAMFELAKLCHYGKIGRDIHAAIEWYKKAAEHDHIQSIESLGEIYSNYGLDISEAFKWRERSAQFGDARSQYFCGLALLEGIGTEVNVAQAKVWLQKAFDGGRVEAAWFLVKADGKPPQSVFEMVDREKLAQVVHLVEDPKLRMFLAEAYELGLGGEKDYLAAVTQYLTLLHQGFSMADGRPHKHQDWAMERIVDLFATGKANFDHDSRYVPGNPELLARRLEDNRTKVSSSKAMEQIGTMYLDGAKLPHNPNKAVEWLALAAQSGSSSAMFRLGELWEDDQIGEQDLKESVAWFREAANRNHPKAQYRLGAALFEGRGCDADPIEAWKWLKLSSENGSPEADQLLARVTSQLSEDDLRSARMRKDSFKPTVSSNE